MTIGVKGVPNIYPPSSGKPLVWAKDTLRGMGIVKIHMSASLSPEKSVCGRLNVITSTYSQPDYTPLHVGYATNADGLKQAASGTVYANRTTAANAFCAHCQRVSATFKAMVSAAQHETIV